MKIKKKVPVPPNEYKPTMTLGWPAGPGQAFIRDPRTEGKTMVSTVELSAYFENEVRAGNTFYYFLHAKDIFHPIYIRFNPDGSEDVVEKLETGEYRWISTLAKGEGHWFIAFLYNQYYNILAD